MGRALTGEEVVVVVVASDQISSLPGTTSRDLLGVVVVVAVVEGRSLEGQGTRVSLVRVEAEAIRSVRV